MHRVFYVAVFSNMTQCQRALYRVALYVIVNNVTTAMLGRSVRVAERLELPTLDHGVAGLSPAGGEILPEPKRRFIAQSLSCSLFHRLEMTEILLKGRKILTHPSSNA